MRLKEANIDWAEYNRQRGHDALDILGVVPLFGEGFDAINGIWYALEGDYLNASLSMAAVVPVVGTAATTTKVGLKLAAKRGTQYTKSSLKLGQQMHKAYKASLHNPAQQMFKEYVLPSERRMDFLDASKGIIYELKPFNPRAMKAGQKSA
jgi:hypothetical protein